MRHDTPGQQELRQKGAATLRVICTVCLPPTDEIYGMLNLFVSLYLSTQTCSIPRNTSAI